jgi:hypothetical protein
MHWNKSYDKSTIGFVKSPAFNPLQMSAVGRAGVPALCEVQILMSQTLDTMPCIIEINTSSCKIAILNL